MLLPRILTALVLLALLLPAMLVKSVVPFALLTLLLIGAAGWEWGRLNGTQAWASLSLGGLVTVLCGSAWVAGWAVHAPAAAWWLVCGAWVLGGAYALRVGPQAWPKLPMSVRLVLGVLVLVAAWLALAAGRARGLNFLLSAFCLVWMADIAAYFGGRAFGKNKLAPSISPGKSWEGVWSGLLGVMLMAMAWVLIEAQQGAASPSLFQHLYHVLGAWGAIVAILFLVVLSVMGDLVESLAKRAVAAKDSSGLLPGHGGVLDRVDALLPVLPAVMALATL